MAEEKRIAAEKLKAEREALAEEKRIAAEKLKAEREALAEQKRIAAEEAKAEREALAEKARQERDEQARLRKLKMEEQEKKRQANAEARKQVDFDRYQMALEADKKKIEEAKSRPTFSLFGLGGNAPEEEAEQPATVPKPAAAPKPKAPVKKVVAPRGVPMIDQWVLNDDQTISGRISGSDSFKDGAPVTTSPISGKAISGSIAQTKSGSRCDSFECFDLLTSLLRMYHYNSRYFLGDEGQAASGGALFGFFGSSSPAPAPAPKPQPASPAPESPKKSPTFALFGGGSPAPAPKPQPASPAPTAPKLKKSPTFALFGGGSPKPAPASNDKAKQVAEQKKRAAEEARAKAASEVCR